jgi:hypothetical protein
MGDNSQVAVRGGKAFSQLKWSSEEESQQLEAEGEEGKR